jgi:hypothetical protein
MSGIRIIGKLRKASPALRVREWGGGSGGGHRGSGGGWGGWGGWDNGGW